MLTFLKSFRPIVIPVFMFCFGVFFTAYFSSMGNDAYERINVFGCKKPLSLEHIDPNNTTRHADGALGTLSTINGKIYSGGGDQVIRVWDQYSGIFLHYFQIHRGDIQKILSHDKLLISVANDGLINIVDTLRNEHCTFRGHNSPILGASIYGRELYTASADGNVHLYGMDDRDLKAIFRSQSGKANTVLATERYVIVGYVDGGIYIWDRNWLKTGDSDWKITINWNNSGFFVEITDPLRKLAGHLGEVRVVHTSNGSILASAGLDKMVRLWDLNTGEELQSIYIGQKIGLNEILLYGNKLYVASNSLMEISIFSLSEDMRAIKSTVVLKNELPPEQGERKRNYSDIDVINLNKKGTCLYAGTSDGSIVGWDLTTSPEKAFLGHLGYGKGQPAYARCE